ncbi:MAG TPA: hypothetical protein VI756_09485 [Blastocatellia bacterium]
MNKSKKARRASLSTASNRRAARIRRSIALAIVVGILLAITGSLLAKRENTRFGPNHLNLKPAAFPFQTAPTPTPAKEYIYQGGGGPLIATEETPAPGATPTPGPTPPMFSSISLTTGNPGTTYNDVSITGSGLQSPVSISFHSVGVSASSIVVVSSTEVTFTITVSPDATLTTYTVSLTSDGVAASGTASFTVVAPGSSAPGAPTITSVMPSTIYTGQSAVPVMIAGSGFSTVNAASGVTITNSQHSSSGITINSITPESNTVILLSVTVSATAPTGADTLTVANSVSSTHTTITIATAPNTQPSIASLTAASGSPVYWSSTPEQFTALGHNFTGAVFLLDGQQISGATITPGGGNAYDTATFPLTFTVAGYHVIYAENTSNFSLSNAEQLVVENPVPTAIQVTSGSNPVVGSPGETITISAMNLVASGNGGDDTGSVLLVNGQKRGATATQSLLTGNLLASDLAGAAGTTLSLVIQSPPPGGGNSSTLTITLNNPTPTITSFSPDAWPVNGGPFTLTINGSGFLPGAKVTALGAQITPASITPNQITVQISNSETVSGTQVIEVTNPAPTPAPAVASLPFNAPGTCSWVTTYSGNGTYAYLDGTGSNAEWADPCSAVVAKDPTSGYMCLFVCDTDNQRIRMVYLQGPNIGESVTIAGTGVAGSNIPPINPNNELVVVWRGGPALQSMLNFPRGICAQINSSGVLEALYIADTDNNAIVSLTPGSPSSNSNWLIKPVAGYEGVPGYPPNSSGLYPVGFNQPTGIAYNPTDGLLYVSDSGNSQISKTTVNGTISTVAQVAGSDPLGVTIGASSGLVYFTDIVTQTIYSVTTSGANLTAVAGGTAGFKDGTGSSAEFLNPREVFSTTDATDGEVVYIADAANERIRKLVTSSKAVSTYSGDGTTGTQNGDCLSSSTFNHPRCVTPGVSGEFYVMDSLNNLIREIK